MSSGESRESVETISVTPLLSTRTITIETWNVRTVYKLEKKQYKLQWIFKKKTTT